MLKDLEIKDAKPMEEMAKELTTLEKQIKKKQKKIDRIIKKNKSVLLFQSIWFLKTECTQKLQNDLISLISRKMDLEEQLHNKQVQSEKECLESLESMMSEYIHGMW